MKKILFSDKYGLTQLVLDGEKTQTRRLISEKTIEKAEQYIVDYFNDTLDSIPLEDMLLNANQLMGVPSLSSYRIGEVVSIAQSYNDVYEELKRTYGSSSSFTRGFFHKFIQGGRMPVSNKIFVRADIMLHRIKITNVRVERLQDISEVECLLEGICQGIPALDSGMYAYSFAGTCDLFASPKSAYAALIDKICGDGTWVSNPWVYVYDFKLIN